jgi:hypothetical protein
LRDRERERERERESGERARRERARERKERERERKMSWDLGVIRPVVIVIIGALVSGGVGASGYVVCVVRGPGGSIVHLVVIAPANLQTISSQRREKNGWLLAPRQSDSARPIHSSRMPTLLLLLVVSVK